MATSLAEGKLNLAQLYSAKIFTLCHILLVAEELGKYSV